jgi:hypothetical protein
VSLGDEACGEVVCVRSATREGDREGLGDEAVGERGGRAAGVRIHGAADGVVAARGFYITPGASASYHSVDWRFETAADDHAFIILHYHRWEDEGVFAEGSGAC